MAALVVQWTDSVGSPTTPACEPRLRIARSPGRASPGPPPGWPGIRVRVPRPLWDLVLVWSASPTRVVVYEGATPTRPTTAVSCDNRRSGWSLTAKVTAKTASGPGEGGHPRAAHADSMPPAHQRTDQQVRPLQRVCRLLLVRPTPRRQRRWRGRAGGTVRRLPRLLVGGRLPWGAQDGSRPRSRLQRSACRARQGQQGSPTCLPSLVSARAVSRNAGWPRPFL
jgi:hypothetical protein